MYYLVPIPKQFVDNSGVPYSGGKVSVYNSGDSDTTLARIYSSANSEELVPNPCLLDANGSWQCFVPADIPYDYVVEDAYGNVVFQYQSVVPGGDGSGSDRTTVTSEDGSIDIQESYSEETRTRRFDLAVSDSVVSSARFSETGALASSAGTYDYSSLTESRIVGNDILLRDGHLALNSGTYHLTLSILLENSSVDDSYYTAVMNVLGVTSKALWDNSFIHSESIEFSLDIVVDEDNTAVVPGISGLPSGISCGLSNMDVHKICVGPKGDRGEVGPMPDLDQSVPDNSEATESAPSTAAVFDFAISGVKVNGSELEKDENKKVNISVPVDKVFIFRDIEFNRTLVKAAWDAHKVVQMWINTPSFRTILTEIETPDADTEVYHFTAIVPANRNRLWLDPAWGIFDAQFIYTISTGTYRYGGSSKDIVSPVQSDWNQSDTTALDYVKNKPDLTLKENVANKTETVRQASSADDTRYPSEAAVRSAIDSAVSAAYKAAGTKRASELTSSLLVAANEGNVYNITEAGTTDNNFVDGAGKTINVGDNVGVCKVGNDYKFDLLSGFVDLSDYVQKSNTSGLLKNDGTVDTSDYLTKTGDGSNVTITPDGSSGTTFSSGGKLSALAQKFINLVSSLKALAFKDKVSDSDIDGVISASHIPDSVKDKIIFIEGSISRTIVGAQYVYTVTCDTTYSEITQLLSSGKVPICKFIATFGNSSRTWFFYYHVTFDNLKHSFGSVDNNDTSGDEASYVSCVYVKTDNSWTFIEIANYDRSYWTDALAGKQNTISDLSTIRSGASAGASALQPSGDGSNLSVTPDGSSTGYDLGNSTNLKAFAQKFKNLVGSIKALAFKDKASYNDLSSGVQSSLDKADTALQPSDVASSVTSGDITHVPTADAVWIASVNSLHASHSSSAELTYQRNASSDTGNLPAIQNITGSLLNTYISTFLGNEDTQILYNRNGGESLLLLSRGSSATYWGALAVSFKDNYLRIGRNSNDSANVFTKASAGYSDKAGESDIAQNVKTAIRDYAIYRNVGFNFDNTDGVDAATNWFFFADLNVTDASTGQYDAIRIVGKFYDSQGNWNQSDVYEVEFEILFNIASGSISIRYNTPGYEYPIFALSGASTSKRKVIFFRRRTTYDVVRIVYSVESTVSSSYLTLYTSKTFASSSTNPASYSAITTASVRFGGGKGSTSQPVYVNANGEVKPCDYAISVNPGGTPGSAANTLYFC